MIQILTKVLRVIWQHACGREFCWFVVWETRHATYKIKSVLKGTETEERPHEIVAYLAREISEQKRVDQAVSLSRPSVAASVGAPMQSPDTGIAGPSGKDAGGNSSSSNSMIHVILPGDKDAQRKKHKAKIAYHEKAFGMEAELKREMGAVPVIAADISSLTFAALTGDASWITGGDAWRVLLAEHPSLQPIGVSFRETIQKKKAEQCKYVLLFSVRDDKAFLLRV